MSLKTVRIHTSNITPEFAKELVKNEGECKLTYDKLTNMLKQFREMEKKGDLAIREDCRRRIASCEEYMLNIKTAYNTARNISKKTKSNRKVTFLGK
jgi:hypothetical protein